MKYILGIFVFVFTFTSCGTMRRFKTSDFSTINSVKGLEGNYLNRNSERISILSCFNIREEANFITIISENPNEIKLTYINDSSIIQERIFTGEMGKNYFEIYFLKQQSFIPILYSSCNIDRVRIGKTNDEKLLIKKFVDQSGNLLFFGGGYSVETPYKFSEAKENRDYTPIHENGLWGYSDLSGDIVIPKKYDFASLFDKGVARVKLNDKWGLINKQGKEIAPIKYDKISLVDTLSTPLIFRVSIEGKTGILDIDGNELIPAIYDYIGYSVSPDPNYMVAIRLGDKLGRATRTQVIIPAIYSEQVNFLGDRIVYKRDGKNYIADKDGYEYEAEGNLFLGFKAKLETKRKIQLEEQKIE